MVIHFFIKVMLVKLVFRASIIVLRQVIISIDFKAVISFRIIIDIEVSSFKPNFIVVNRYFGIVSWISSIETNKNINFKMAIIFELKLEHFMYLVTTFAINIKVVVE